MGIGETVTLTQTEMTIVQEKIRQTDLNVTLAEWAAPGGNGTLTINIENAGITSFKVTDRGMDLYYCDSVGETKRVNSFTGTIDSDIINKGFWDPAEILIIAIPITPSPKWVWFTSPNGVTASRNVIPV